MKANEPKRKIFTDAVDLLGGGDNATAAVGSVVEMLDINAIRPFRDHPFRLYEGERLEDMVESIKEHGILNPVIVRKMHYGYEMLSGHNRQNAGKIAGLKEIPAIVKDNLLDAEAYVYVIETNLMQRSFSDLQISEKAAVLAERYDKVISQGKRNDILAEIEGLKSVETTSGHSDQKLWSRDGLASEYGLSSSSVARLLRVNNLIPEFKEKLDKNELQLMAAVQLSFMPEAAQKLALDASEKSGIVINKEIAKKVRSAPMTEKAITEAVAGVQPEPHPLGIVEEEKPVYKPIKLSADIREKYFADTNTKEIEDIVDKALAAWFKKKR